ncbi:hypothetical protein K458DRAFT_365333 [Lentithecium fluviatile CBS 122367]|uniref:PH domain-containing protein n=1 Tax=Lentithecium fluviatile CBS 122367 TaxID=1168545 RepID=A0A6G1J4I7_9PLEO|nr:hypothetical protein K458DRAFT_365333 [Lentithecium fluviatile CBS 122367]
MHSHNMDEPAPSDPPPRFSRYRSVRRAQQQAHAESQNAAVPAVPPMPALPPQKEEPAPPVSRSMSRYHRRPTTSHAPTAKAPPLRTATIEVPPLTSAQASAAGRNRALSSPHARVANNVQPQVPNTSRAREAAPTTTAEERPRPRTARDEAKQLLQAEQERQRRVKEKLEAEKREKIKAEQAKQAEQERQRREGEAERLRAQREAEEAEQLRRQQQQEEKERGKRLQKAESSKRLQEREEAERRARAEEASRRVPASPPVSPPRHGFSLFKRRKDGAHSSPEGSPSSKPPKTSHENREMDTIRPGGGGAVLGIDAPVSAVNAGDRRVTVVCNRKAFMLPVTPETTAQDLLKSAALCMTEPIDVDADLLMESFRKVGLRRPLRLYEHVRDVMNSWDNDAQNDLEISVVEAQYWDHDLLVASKVPDSKPDGMSCYIQYSSRPGKWSKKFVTLRSDGQLVMARNETAKEQENICHISDFDIYKPSERKALKIKPPKKYIWAVKSQQKSNIFSDETRYVHFFSTNDQSTADTFYNAVQVSRSWHLKHVMGEGQKKKAQESKSANGSLTNSNTLGGFEKGGSASHTRNTSVGSYYQLGSFKPLFDLDSFSRDLDAVASSRDDPPLARGNTQAMHARKMSTRAKNPPPTAFSRSGLVNDIPPPAADGPVTDRTDSITQSSGFASTSLLGDVYSQRQRALQERDKPPSGPFTEGPSLINNIDSMALAAANDGGLARKSSVRSNHMRSSSDIQRSASTRTKPRPLVDLTPQYREPPQHRNKGKGFAPEPGTGPLIENATSLEEPIKIPPSTDWRSRPAGRTHGTYGTGGHERTRSLKGRGEGLAAYTVNNHTGAPNDESNAFTGGGLLARAGFSQGHQPVGHGVMDGSKARGPMLDVRDNSRFASGSLLASVDQRQGPTRPVIDRDNRRSVDLG